MLLPSIPSLYRTACYGKGDAARSDARMVLEAMAQEHGVSIGDLLRRAGMDVGAYLFTKPRQPTAAVVQSLVPQEQANPLLAALKALLPYAEHRVDELLEEAEDEPGDADARRYADEAWHALLTARAAVSKAEDGLS